MKSLSSRAGRLVCWVLPAPRSALPQKPSHTMDTEEQEFAELRARYSDSDDEAEPQPVAMHLDVNNILGEGQQPGGEGLEELEEEEDADDDGELAAAMDWADMREGAPQISRQRLPGSCLYASMPSQPPSPLFSCLHTAPCPLVQSPCPLAADLMESKGGTTGAFQGAAWRPNAHANRTAALQPRTNQQQRLESRFNGGAMQVRGGDVYDDPLDALGKHAGRVAASVANEVRTHEARTTALRQRVGVDKSDRATVEQALDPRTRMVLFKMLNRGLFSEINGCVSTGKEANVYHASTADGTDLAIKVYKTSVLVFKDRDRLGLVCVCVCARACTCSRAPIPDMHTSQPYVSGRPDSSHDGCLRSYGHSNAW